MQYATTPTFRGYGNKLEEVPVQSNGFLSDWFFSMFAAAAEFAHSPWLVIAYVIAVVAMFVLVAYFDNPVKFFGVSIVCGYSVIQTYSLFNASHYIVEYTPAGWEVVAKSLWFAALFTVMFVWGLSRLLQYVVSMSMSVGLGGLLAPLNPLKFLDKLRANDKDLDELDEGSAKNPKRRITAIMFTDIVGYSAQMGKNEKATLAKLEVHNQIMRNQIVRNRGHVIKTIGDAFMVKYRSAESAVQCAMDCQRAIGEYNKTKSNPDDQFHIRIGIHMGEVTDTGSDAFGEGVNIAARTEPKADPDGICVTDVIVAAARNKVPAHFQSMGRLPMKNITNPPELFKVFAIEQQQSVAKVAKAGPAASGAAGAATAGSPGGVFKI